jgi:hypothetical protein
MERRSARPYFVLPHPLLKDACASRRSITAFYGNRARAFRDPLGLSFRSSNLDPFWVASVLRLLGKRNGSRSASSSRGVIVPPGGPGAARELGGHVHPPPAGAASDPTLTTPHDSALGGPDKCRITYLRNMVKRIWELFLARADTAILLSWPALARPSRLGTRVPA